MTRFAWAAVFCLAVPLCFAGCRRAAPEPEPDPAPPAPQANPNPTPPPKPDPKPAPKPDPKPVDPTKPSDREQAQGIWALERFNDRGRELDAEQVRLNRMMLVWQGDRYDYCWQGEVQQQGTFHLDPSASPKRIEKKPLPGEIDLPMKGIYEINGDTLRLALSVTTSYPADISPDPSTVILEYRRAGKLGDRNAPILGTGTPLPVEELARDMADADRFKRYREKILIVEGTLLAHSETPGESITIFKGDGPDGKVRLITCEFGFNKRDAVKALPVGQRVRVAGECINMFAGKLTLRGATVLK
jgi:uncharacterized protein (TIGR03067 family)